MGVDTAITLKPGARVYDVANVIGVLVGHASTLDVMSQGGLSHRVSGVEVKASGFPGTSVIQIAPTTLVPDGLSWLYHHEWSDGPPGSTGMLPGSRPLTRAIGAALIEIFGGEVDFNDCDDIEVDWSAPGYLVIASDGPEWDAYQRAMFEVEPLTQSDLDVAASYAGRGA